MRERASLQDWIRHWRDSSPVGPRGRILIKGTSISLVGFALLRLAFMVRLLAKTRFLSLEDVGRLTLATSIVTLLFIASEGFPLGLLRFVSVLYGESSAVRERRKIESQVKGLVRYTYALALPIYVALTALSCLLARPIALGVFGDEALAPVARIISLGLFFSSITKLNAALLRSRRHVIYQHVTQGGEVLLMLALVLAAWSRRGDLSVFAYALVAANAAVLAYSFFPIKRIMPFLFDRDVPTIRGKAPLLRFSLLGSLGAVTGRLRADISTAAVAFFLSPADVAVYAVAVNVAMVPGMCLAALNTILAPVVAGLFGIGNIRAVQKVHRKSAISLLASGLVFFLLFLLAGRWLLAIFGPAYGEAYVPLLIIAASVVVECGTGSVVTIINMSGRPGWNAFNRAAVLPIFMVMCSQMVPRFEIVGAAVAFGVSRVVMAILGLSELLVFYHRDKQSAASKPRSAIDSEQNDQT
ncbi:MAG: oligosaccharide flippase family protein [Lentisphaerae bacterium]|nr:oligosaccharide flippase family protein [Lentisphaerota bacterium]